MSVSAFDHRLLSHLFGAPELARLFAVEAEIAAMVRFEVAMALAQAEAGLIPAEAAPAIAAAGERFVPDLEALAAGTARDGVVAVEFVRQFRAAVEGPHGKHAHFGTTSQDVVDTSLVLRLKPALAGLGAGLARLDAALSELARTFGSNRLMGRTRMQDALPIMVADRLSSWQAPLARSARRLEAAGREALVVQLGGPVGTLETMAGKGPAVRARLADLLGLGDPGACWHSQRDGIVALAQAMAAVSGVLGKFGQDIALMALVGGELKLSGGGGSSAMAHKSNPVSAEALVALARYSATLAGAMDQALLHEFERSGAAWGLEWLAFPQIVVATGGSVRLGETLLGQITEIGQGEGGGNG